MKHKIIIIGGGAAGLMAAIFAARNHNEVVVLEHTDKIGKKLLSTGNGRCNLTNTDMNMSCYHCKDSRFVASVLNRFNETNTMEFFHQLGLYFKNRDGYIYPYSNQASSVLEVLLLECRKLGVKIQYEIEINKITPIKKGNKFKINTYQEEYLCDKVIIATGSKAAPKTGSDGSGYKLLKQLGHHIVTPLPALTALRCSNKCTKSLAGVRTDGVVSIYVDKELKGKDQGEIQLTDYGISGIPVFQVSRYASVALNNHKKVEAVIDFFPLQEYEQLLSWMKEKFTKNPERTLEEHFIGVLNNKLAKVIIKEAGFLSEQPGSSFNENELKALVQKIKYFSFTVTKTNAYDQAQVCCGGVSIDDINYDTLESKVVPNLYVAGEVIDVDGICGGYNLQWAWSTGYIAGTHAGE